MTSSALPDDADQPYGPRRWGAVFALVWLFYGMEAAASGLALWAARLEAFRPRTVLLAAMLGGFFSLCFTCYSAAVGGSLRPSPTPAP